MAQAGGSRRGRKWLDSGYMLKVEHQDFLTDWLWGVREKEGSRDNYGVFGLSD